MSNKDQVELTPEQKAQIPIYRERYRKIAESTGDCDRDKANAIMVKAYEYQKMNIPIEFLWFDSPAQGALAAAKICKLPPQKTAKDAIANYPAMEVSIEDVRGVYDKMSAGAPEAYWVAFYAFLAYELKVKHDELVGIVDEIVRTCGAHWTFTTPDKTSGLVIMCERPVEQHYDSEGRLHNPDGLAVRFKDGTGLCAVNGEVFKNMFDMQSHLDKKKKAKK